MLDQPSMRAAVEELKTVDPAVIGAAIVSYDGLVMVSTHNDEDHNDTMAAYTCEVLTKGRTTIRELNFGELHGEIVFGTQGALMIRPMNEEMVLVAEVNTNVRVGKVYQAMGKIIEKFGP